MIIEMATCSSVPTIAAKMPPSSSGASGPINAVVSVKKFRCFSGLHAADAVNTTIPASADDQDQPGRGHQRADDAVHDRHPVQHGRADRGQHAPGR